MGRKEGRKLIIKYAECVNACYCDKEEEQQQARNGNGIYKMERLLYFTIHSNRKFLFLRGHKVQVQFVKLNEQAQFLHVV